MLEGHGEVGTQRGVWLRIPGVGWACKVLGLCLEFQQDTQSGKGGTISR
jgi:hypothetical protein